MTRLKIKASAVNRQGEKNQIVGIILSPREGLGNQPPTPWRSRLKALLMQGHGHGVCPGWLVSHLFWLFRLREV